MPAEQAGGTPEPRNLYRLELAAPQSVSDCTVVVWQVAAVYS